MGGAWAQCAEAQPAAGEGSARAHNNGHTAKVNAFHHPLAMPLPVTLTTSPLTTSTTATTTTTATTATAANHYCHITGIE